MKINFQNPLTGYTGIGLLFTVICTKRVGRFGRKRLWRLKTKYPKTTEPPKPGGSFTKYVEKILFN